MIKYFIVSVFRKSVMKVCFPNPLNFMVLVFMIGHIVHFVAGMYTVMATFVASAGNEKHPQVGFIEFRVFHSP